MIQATKTHTKFNKYLKTKERGKKFQVSSLCREIADNGREFKIYVKETFDNVTEFKIHETEILILVTETFDNGAEIKIHETEISDEVT